MKVFLLEKITSFFNNLIVVVVFRKHVVVIVDLLSFFFFEIKMDYLKNNDNDDDLGAS